jgi:predicted SAM-dependent methyltransferase
MHPGVMLYVMDHLDKLDGHVLEVGSYDVNGGLTELVPHRIGTDMRPGRGVDVVCKAEDLLDHFKPCEFDAVVTTETLEHVEKWREAITAMWAVLKESGWLVVTIASTKKGRHAYPDDYWRMEPRHVMEIFPGAQDVRIVDRISLGWVVQKNRDLPDLSKIELLRVP